MENNQNVNYKESPDFGYYDDTKILPTIDLSKFNRRELKNLAYTIAGRSNPKYGVTYGEVLTDKVNVEGRPNQQDRFKRLVKKQYDKNVKHTQQMERAQRAGQGDTKAMQEYINTGQNEVAKYVAPLLGVPAASVLAGTGVVAPAVKQTIKTMMNPAAAKTTIGAVAATGLDAAGVAAGTRGLSDMVFNRWLKGKFKWSDIPEFALNVADVLPGAAAVNAAVGAAQDMKRVRNAVKYINEAVSDINTPATRVGTGLDIDTPTNTPTNTPVEVSPTGLTAPTDIDPNNIIAARIPSQESTTPTPTAPATTAPASAVQPAPTPAATPAPAPAPAPIPTPAPARFTVDIYGQRFGRDDIEGMLRGAGYNDVDIAEALFTFDRAEYNSNPYAFHNSVTSRRLDRAQRGIRATDIESTDGNVYSVEDMIEILRNEGFHDQAITDRINTALQQAYPIDPKYVTPLELTDEGLARYVDSLDESYLLNEYNYYLSRQKHIDRDAITRRYKGNTEALNASDQRIFDALARRLSSEYSIDFSNLSEDGYVKIKQFLRSKGRISGDIDHMHWFQMRDALPRDSYGQVVVTEADGTTRPLKYGERPPFTDKGRYKAGRQALQMFDDVPRGHAVAETHTSLDSELLKLNGALRRYGFEPGQLSVELASTHPYGNSLQFERMYMRDMLYYRDLLPDHEKVLLDKILDGKYGLEVNWHDLQGTDLLDLMRYEYQDLTTRLVERLSAPWRKIKSIDTRPEIQKAEMPSYTGNVDNDIKELLNSGNFSPAIKRQPIHVFKNAKGGTLGKNISLIGCTNPILEQKPSKFLKGGKIGKFTTGGPVQTFDLNESPSVTQYWDAYAAQNNKPFTVVPEAPIDENELVKRQAWAESAGNDSAGSHKGAKGRYQIMPKTLIEYQKATGDIGNIYNPVYNRRVRDWEFNRYKNSDQVNRGEPTDSVKMGRRLAIYNYGYGNTRKALNRSDSLGIDTDTSFDWLQEFPQETQDYVNFVLRGKDTGGHRTQAAYENRNK